MDTNGYLFEKELEERFKRISQGTEVHRMRQTGMEKRRTGNAVRDIQSGGIVVHPVLGDRID